MHARDADRRSILLFVVLQGSLDQSDGSFSIKKGASSARRLSKSFCSN